MHCEEVTNLRTLPRNTTNKGFGKTSQVKAMDHMKSSYSTLPEIGAQVYEVIRPAAPVILKYRKVHLRGLCTKTIPLYLYNI